MTEKENLLRVIEGKEPAWVPRFSMGPPVKWFDDPYPPAITWAMFDIYPIKHLKNGGYIDMFGVEFTGTESMGGIALPAPGKHILDDITKWRDVIKLPDLEGVDWEKACDRAVKDVDRNETAVTQGSHVGYFQHLMNFMGFENGLIAMAEEPDECYGLLEYLADFYDAVAKKVIHYLKPDVFSIADDTATALNPFISMDMYRRLIKPFHKRLADIANDAGVPVSMHNCGRCEDAIPDWRDIGVRLWNPAQVMNDLLGIKEKYGNSLVLCGCWDSSGPAGWSGASEELVRSDVRKCIDTYAPGGGFMFWGSVYGPADDEEVSRRAGWIADEYNRYGRTFYRKN